MYIYFILWHNIAINAFVFLLQDQLSSLVDTYYISNVNHTLLNIQFKNVVSVFYQYLPHHVYIMLYIMFKSIW